MRDTLYPDPEPGSWLTGSSWDRTCDPGPIGSTPQPGQLEEPDPGPGPSSSTPPALRCGCCGADMALDPFHPCPPGPDIPF